MKSHSHQVRSDSKGGYLVTDTYKGRRGSRSETHGVDRNGVKHDSETSSKNSKEFTPSIHGIFSLFGITLLIIAFVSFLFAINGWGDGTFIKEYPSTMGTGHHLYYFDVFGYILNLKNGTSSSVTKLFSCFTDISWDDWGNVVGACKNIGHCFIWFINFLWFLLKFLFCEPVQLLSIFLGFSSTSLFGKGFLDFLGSYLNNMW